VLGIGKSVVKYIAIRSQFSIHVLYNVFTSEERNNPGYISYVQNSDYMNFKAKDA